MTLRILTQRRWWHLGLRLSRRLAKHKRRAFLQAWDDVWEAFNPFRSFLFYLQHPVLYFQVQIGLRKLRRLRAEGRTEIRL